MLHRNDLRRAHRVVYEAFKGPVPAGLDLDHLCRVRSCVNPDHLEPVTRAVNLNRGIKNRAALHAKTHCPNGHEYTADNTRWYHPPSKKYAHRQCLFCLADNHARNNGRRS